MNPNEQNPEAPSVETPAAPRRRRGGARGPRASATKRSTKLSLLGWRLSKQLTQREAAVILGMSQPAYARFELEKRYPRGKGLVKRLQIVTGLPLHIIVGIDE